jgi:hypothetical protein
MLQLTQQIEVVIKNQMEEDSHPPTQRILPQEFSPEKNSLE